MNVTLQDAINAFGILKERVNENGFLAECYNLGISALKTVKDGNYIIEDKEMESMIKKIANYDCTGKDCNECPYYQIDLHKHSCIPYTCQQLFLRKEIETWVHVHWNELKTL